MRKPSAKRLFLDIRENVRVIRLRRFHRNEILIGADEQNNADIRAALVLIILYAGVSAFEIVNILIFDAVNVP